MMKIYGSGDNRLQIYYETYHLIINTKSRGRYTVNKDYEFICGKDYAVISGQEALSLMHDLKKWLQEGVDHVDETTKETT